MIRAFRSIPAAAAIPREALQRRRPQVIVRAPGAPRLLETGAEPHAVTLLGIGIRETADTLPAFEDVFDADEFVEYVDEDIEPVSCVRARVAPRRPPAPSSRRRRPVTLLDGVHDALATDYRAEAARLLASGVFR
jgi:hypothetical protein